VYFVLLNTALHILLTLMPVPFWPNVWYSKVMTITMQPRILVNNCLFKCCNRFTSNYILPHAHRHRVLGCISNYAHPWHTATKLDQPTVTLNRDFSRGLYTCTVLMYNLYIYTSVKFYKTKIEQKEQISIFIFLYLLQTEAICKVTLCTSKQNTMKT